MRARMRMLAGLGAVCVVALTAAVALRAPSLVASALGDALASNGISPAHVELDRIGLSGAHGRAHALSTPGGLGLRLEDLTVHYSITGVLAGRIERVQVGELTVEAALVEGRLSIGPLDAWIHAAPPSARPRPAGTSVRSPRQAPTARSTPPIFPMEVHITRSALRLRDGDDEWLAEGPLGATLDAGGIQSLTASLDLRGPGAIGAKLEVRSRSTRSLEIALSGDAPAAALAPGAPRISFATRTIAQGGWLRFWEAASRGLGVEELSASSQLEANLSGLTWRGRSLSARAKGSGRVAQGRFSFDVGELHVEGLDAPLDASAVVSGAIAPARIERARVSVAPFVTPGLELPAIVSSFRGSLTADAASGSLALTVGPGDLSLASTRVQEGHLDATLAVEATRERFEARMPECGVVRLESARVPETLRLGAAEICVRDANEPLIRWEGGEPQSAQYHVVARSRTPLAVSAGEDTAIRAVLPVVDIRGDLSRPEVLLAVSGGQLGSDSISYALRDAEARVRLEGSAWWVELERALLDPLPGAPLGAPLSVSGTVTGGSEFARFALAASDSRDRVTLRTHGVHRFATGYGAARIEMPPAHFSEQGLRIDELLADAADLPTLSGEIGASGALAWNPRQVVPNVDVSAARIDASMEGVTVHQANGVISVRGIDPFATGPEQRISAAEMNVGVPVSEVDLTFEVAHGTRFQISRLGARFAGGRATLRGVVDTSAPDQSLRVDLDAVDAAEVVRIAEVHDIVVRGRVSGFVPVEIRDGAVSIPGGALRAAGGGLIQVPPDPSAPPVDASGAPAAFVREVLSDFHFTDLDLAIDGELGGVLRLVFSIRGANPSVQGGREVHLKLTVNESITGAVRAVELWRVLLERARTRGSGPTAVDSTEREQDNGPQLVAGENP